MEHQLWKAIVAVLAALDKPRRRPRCTFRDADIVAVFYWSVVCDRPACWACCRENWPPHLRRRQLPDPSTLSRRLRWPSVVALLEALERRVIAPKGPDLFWMIDGKPLPIGGCSKDRQAGYGKAAGTKAKGYKLHAVVGVGGTVAAWRVAPMNKDERVMARRLLRQAEIAGYVVADSNYDDNKIHAVCDAHGALQLLTPKRGGPGKGLGHRRQEPGRLRSLERVYHPTSDFARSLLQQRVAVERYFGNLTGFGGGLTHLPPWVRTHRRVHRWVQTKLVVNGLRIQLQQRTCAA